MVVQAQGIYKMYVPHICLSILPENLPFCKGHMDGDFSLNFPWDVFPMMKKSREIPWFSPWKMNHPFRKENDLNQTSMIMFMLIFRGASIFEIPSFGS